MSGTYTKAQAEATKRYLQKMGNFKIRCTKEEKERYTAAAEKAGMSLNAFTLKALDEKIFRDSNSPALRALYSQEKEMK